jgi:hypothetical protein
MAKRCDRCHKRIGFWENDVMQFYDILENSVYYHTGCYITKLLYELGEAHETITELKNVMRK